MKLMLALVQIVLALAFTLRYNWCMETGANKMKLKTGMALTERNAAILANQLYTAFYALPWAERKPVASQVLAKLNSMSHAMSTTQYCKLLDFTYDVQHNYS